ncbi:MAG: sigma-54-dependent Fis family transcriptional regulator [Thiotrichaceae bacterium]|nr:sigma-54-dependent Fis family transcriptional regulator [Thiotrichaceae bacterium]
MSNIKPNSSDKKQEIDQFKRNSVLIVDDEPGIRRFLHKGLAPYFGLIEVAKDAQSAEKLRQRCHFDLIISDIRLPDKSGLDWISEIRQQEGTTSVIFITAHANLAIAIAALKAGAADFIMKPFRMQQMLAAIENALQQQQVRRENVVLKRQVDQLYDSGMIGNSAPMKRVYEVLNQVASMPATVLIEGESGTGKELAARALHRWSERKGSFVPINCGAITAELLESELFGHTKGAFTGAQQSREGLFTYADGGTLFLDEIGEMPLSMQVHLLRVLEECSIRPVGANREVPINVRIIAATNRNLKEAVDKGLFRADLYYRLNVISVRLPALRERMDDLPTLVEHFASMLSTEIGIQPPDIRNQDLLCLQNYDWPGNVRELKNVIERCILLKKSPQQCINLHYFGNTEATNQPQDEKLESIEKQHIINILKDEEGNKSAAARRLGVSRKTLERKVKRWKSEDEEIL